MDGQQPSGFTSSDFCGVRREYCPDAGNTNSGKTYKDYPPQEQWREGLFYKGPPQEAASLAELFQSATDIGVFFECIFAKPEVLFIWFKLF